MPSSRRWLAAFLIALFAACVYLPALGSPPLWEPDEGRYAEIAREMVASGDYVTPRNDGFRYFEKPPLVYWAEAAAMHVLGVGEFAARLPSALFTAGEVAATWLIADAMFGAAAATFAAVALFLSPLVFAFALFATLDPALSFFLTTALGAFHAAARSGHLGRGVGRRWMLVAAAMLALGTLAKGPVALVLGGGIPLIWLIWDGRAREILRVPFVSGGAIYLAMVAPWFAMAESRNPGFLRFFFIHEHLLRFLQSTEHGWGIWFFVPIVLGGAWPWLWFVPLGIRELRREDGTSLAGSQSGRSDLRLLLTWFAVVFVFFSIPRSKLGTYILPAMPPIAIVAGLALARLMDVEAKVRDAIRRRFIGVNAALIAVVFVAGSLVVPSQYHPWIFAGLVVSVALFAIAWGCTRQTGAGDALASALMTGGLVAVVMFGKGLRHDTGEVNGYRELGRSIAARLPPDCVLAEYRHHIQSLPFYTGHRAMPVEHWGELTEFDQWVGAGVGDVIGRDDKLGELWSSSACVVLVVNQQDASAVTKMFGERGPAAVATIAAERKKLAIANHLQP